MDESHLGGSRACKKRVAMREFNALAGYPEPKEPRYVGPDLRTIQHRIVASYRGRDFYDGDRNYGYGGLKYDGRHLPIVKEICKEYELSAKSRVLQIGCDKGFFLHDFLEAVPGIQVQGTEISDYAIENCHPRVKPFVVKAPFTTLPFNRSEFDLVIAIGAVYTLNLPDAILSLKEIMRVGRGRSFITLASYDNEEEFWLFKYWSLLGTTVLKPDEWRSVLRHVEYAGDYWFMNAKNLKLVLKEN